MNLKELEELAKNVLFEVESGAVFLPEYITPEQVLKLIERLREAGEVIDFYGDKNNWYKSYTTDQTQEEICVTDLEPSLSIGIDTGEIPIGGKRARQYKEKYKGE